MTCDSPYNFSDLFGAKGMYAAARYIKDKDLIAECKQYCLDVDKAIWEGRFKSDQAPLDAKNPVKPIPGRHSHAAFMIQIGTAALLVQHEKDKESIDFGLKLINHILQNHVNLKNKWPSLKEYDFVEFLDDQKQPYDDNGRILSDSGHCLEFVGLTLKFTKIAKQTKSADGPQLDNIKTIEELMPKILAANFTNGFDEKAGGICKLFDLLSRKAVNTDMPWWSLPETMRAALECLSVAGTESLRQSCLDIAADCHNAFIKYYVKPEVNLMAVQTRAKDGSVVDIIPATPDADPGYHTGLSLIDCIEIIENL